MKSGLPIDAVLPALAAALGAGRSAVLQAPPGTGKSTVVPLALLEERWMAGRRIILLEPRRLAARAVAQRMAQTLGESAGATVGYRMRSDTRVSHRTRIEVVTEGVLTRMLQHDAALEGVGLVIFDEFHERSLHGDLGLALLTDARSTLSTDLRVIVMSATLEGASVARLLDDAPVISAATRTFPVESRYMGQGAPVLPRAGARGHADSPETLVTHSVLRALREEHGDVLAFLPGAPEIRRVQGLLQSANLGSSVSVLPLYGELTGEEQNAALQPVAGGRRRVVLATNIAETGLTIAGIRVVVDSGLVRRSVFDPATGMSRLETQRISRASAQQRAGRAGRTEPGACYRLWSEAAQRALAAFAVPEIMDADLAPLALELARWGAHEAAALRWLDEPPTAMLASARSVLVRLGALDRSGRISAHGREMANLGVHPRLAHMLLRAAQLGCVPLAADLAAILSERDLLRGIQGVRDADIRTRLEILADRRPSQLPMEQGSVHRVRRIARDLSRSVLAQKSARIDPAQHAGPPEHAGPLRNVRDSGVLLAFAYPDRIGKRRAGAEARYTLANGRGAHFSEVQTLSAEELIVAVELDDRRRDARILLAAPLSRAALDAYLAEQLESGESVQWSSREQAVIARRYLRLDAIVLEEKPLPELPPEATRAAMLVGVRELGVGALPWSREARDLQARSEFVRGLEAIPTESWPTVTDEALTAVLDEWLGPWLDGITRREHLARLPMLDLLRARLPWDSQRQLDELAPVHVQVPSGSNIRIDYQDPGAPMADVRLQEVFGLHDTPRVGGGRVPLTFRLLSPARRPVQVTRDLKSFWRGAYAEVRKDLRGRYPKHYWPENPLEAEATRGVRRRR